MMCLFLWICSFVLVIVFFELGYVVFVGDQVDDDLFGFGVFEIEGNLYIVCGV